MQFLDSIGTLGENMLSLLNINSGSVKYDLSVSVKRQEAPYDETFCCRDQFQVIRATRHKTGVSETICVKDGKAIHSLNHRLEW
ncbi:hypothetical protein T265_07172 [Opisthorchis viverrini]|uniref:Uncharacterized protein n=1 Tax=Opisthorchis viverrini TaxID=6198 RepID=A0A074ZHX1_OPIVI|nr:hypothetical protein T265_07172 [Opisthorchis viverrini]KER25372.1 hypothetical protein T265_07172 [Opisthorchis viverrini]